MSESPSKEKMLALWLRGEISEAEMVDTFGLEEWKAYQKILETTANFSISETTSKAEVWSRLSHEIANQDAATVVPMRSRRMFFASAVAAVITLILVAFLFWPASPTAYKTEAGEKLTFYLPDSSSVILNANSSIRFQEKNWDSERMVELSGEAFFSVKKGSQFSVNTSRVSVEVLGTEFNVFNRTERDQITCYHGKVKVSTKDQNAVLTPGMTATANDASSVTVTSIVTEEKPDWSIGKFSFNEEPVENVIAELERQYGVRIDHPEMNTTYTGAFFDNDLKNALLVVCEPLGLDYKIENENRIILSHKP
jgi:transmembrane sensor